MPWHPLPRLLAAATLLAAAPLAAADAPLHFTNDILPFLSKHGCNSGGCHGKAIGQNGFKLSLYGFDPAFDYQALVHESRGRRVSPAAPDDSLILLKAAGGMAHGGGVRFAADSAAYKTLKTWIEQGVPQGAADAPAAVKLEVSPAQHLAGGAGEQPQKVTAQYSDGSSREVTALARYDSQNAELMTVSTEGLVRTTGKGGEAHVMIRYGDLVATARVIQPVGPVLADSIYAAFEPKGFIDELVLAKWKLMHLEPSGAASDEEFLRRVFIDALGALPSPTEIRDFLADAAPDKRDRLIDAVVERPEFADHWAHRLGDLLRNRVGDSNEKANTVEFAKWIRQSLVENKPFDQFVREILTVSGKRKEGNPQMDWWRWAINNENRVEDTAQAFLGKRVSCANCHNHPFENISQTDYWRFAAFFAKVGSVTYGSVDELKLNDKGTVKHPRTEQTLTPKAFGGPEFEFVKDEDPRQKLAGWLTAAENPYFARALVNRVWGHYLGVGLVHPLDDMRPTNPPTNPELLDALAADFVGHGFDLKHLSKTVLKSRVYGLSSAPTENNRADARNYARYYSRRMEPHVLMDAIAGATSVPTKFDDYPEVKKAIQLPNEKTRSDFLEIFGRSERTTPCECETSLAPNLSQVLYLLNSDELERKLAAKSGTVAELEASQQSPAEMVEELFLRTFSRLPRPAELEGALTRLEQSPARRAGIEDLLWTLLNSKEFLFNH
jgi:hypothetical protein